MVQSRKKNKIYRVMLKHYKQTIRCPKCKKGIIHHRQYNIYDCDYINCGQTYYFNDNSGILSTDEAESNVLGNID